MNSKIVPNSFVAISDFHSFDYPFEKIEKYYINEYDKIFILGDATDRGENGIGLGGVELLENIKKLCEQYPDRVIYIPGNHDTFLYEYGKYHDNYSLSFQRQFDTIKAIDDLNKVNPDRVTTLISWLGSLPIQRMHYFNGNKYVFAHAFFNQTLYDKNPNYSLDDMYKLSRSSIEYKLLFQVLWFRKGDSYNFNYVPSNVIEVIGHTPLPSRTGMSLDLKNDSGGTTKVYCVDGGISYGYDMLKYDGKNAEPPRTSPYCHVDTSPKNEDGNDFNNQEDLKILIDGIKETVSKHGMANIRDVFNVILSRTPDWYVFFSRGNRDRIESLGIERVIQLINNYTGIVDDVKSIGEVFLNRLYLEDDEFKKIVDDDKYTLYDELDYSEMELTQDYSNVFENFDNGLNEGTDLEFDYLPLPSGNQLIVICRIDSDKTDSFIEGLKQKYGNGDINNFLIYDYNYLVSTLDPGQMVGLSNTEYSVTMDVSGVIHILDSNGIGIASFGTNGDLGIGTMSDGVGENRR